MRALYEGRFERHLSTADAVHQASLTVLRDRRAKGTEHASVLLGGVCRGWRLAVRMDSGDRTPDTGRPGTIGTGRNWGQRQPAPFS